MTDSNQASPSPKVPVATKTKISYVPFGVFDSEGFLSPPPASTLLIRKTKTNSSGSSTFVISSPSASISGSEEEPATISKDNEPGQTEIAIDEAERSADAILMSDILEQGSSSGSALSQSMEPTVNVAPCDNVNAPIPKLIISKVKSMNANATARKRGPRGKYKKKNQANIDQTTGKRRYTRKKTSSQETALGDTETVTENIEKETLQESDDSDDSVKMAWLSDKGVWNPMDDLRLIYNMMQLQNLEHVHIGVKFSCKYTLDQVTARWKALFLDERVSTVSNLAIKKLRPIAKDRIRQQVLFSTVEEDLIKKVDEPPAGNPELSVFQNLLDQNIDIFFKYRTARIILKHWITLRELNMLDCQKGLDLPDSAMLDQLKLESDKLLSDNVDHSVVRGIVLDNQALLRKMKALDIEIKNLTAIADNVILKGSNVELKMNKLNNLATLKGRKVQFLMKSKEITFGRRTEHNHVDVDLQLEGNANKISRLQGKISLDTDGHFRIYNFGRHTIFVGGQPLLPNSVTVIEDENLIMIGKLSFVFSVNYSFVAYAHLVAQEKKKAESEQQRPKTTEATPTQNDKTKTNSEKPGCSKAAI